jgi:hypothetical protein
MLSSLSLNCRVTYRRSTSASQDTTVATHLGDEVIALNSLLHSREKRATIGESSVGVDGPRAYRESTRLTLSSAPREKLR